MHPNTIKFLVIYVSVSILMAILIPLSFSGLSPSENGLKRSRIGGNVDTGKIYDSGLHHIGPTYEFEKFDISYQNYVDKLSVVASNSFAFTLHISAQFRVMPSQIGDIFRQFTTSWRSPIYSRINTVVKRLSTNQFSVNDYSKDISNVRKIIEDELTLELSQINIEMGSNKFQIQEVEFVGETRQRFLDSAVQIQNNERSIIQRIVNLIIKDTDVQRQQINANTTLIRKINIAEADLTVARATSNSKRIVDEGFATGFNILFSNFNVTSSVDKKKFLRYYALSQNDDVRFIRNANVILNLGQ